jgi:hypothetical protein
MGPRLEMAGVEEIVRKMRGGVDKRGLGRGDWMLVDGGLADTYPR